MFASFQPKLYWRQAVSELAANFDVTLIDTAGRQSKRLVGALSVSDLALMPCQPSGPDIWALEGSIQTVREVQELRPELRNAIVVNGEARTKLSASARQALEEMGVAVIGSLMRRTTIGEATTAVTISVGWTSIPAPESVRARPSRVCVVVFVISRNGRPRSRSHRIASLDPGTASHEIVRTPSMSRRTPSKRDTARV